jgi:hypothetical protein
MRAARITEFRQAQPFRPFDIHLIDSRVLRVDRPEHAMITASLLIVAQSDGALNYIDLQNVLDVQRVPFGKDELSLCSLEAWI